MKDSKKINQADMDAAFQWMNSKDVIEIVNSTLMSLNNISKVLEKCDWSDLKADVAAKTAMNLTKSVDELARLMALVQGKPDQRTEVVGLGDLMKVLSNDQFKQVSDWIDEGMRRVGEPINRTPA